MIIIIRGIEKDLFGDESSFPLGDLGLRNGKLLTVWTKEIKENDVTTYEGGIVKGIDS